MALVTEATIIFIVNKGLWANILIVFIVQDVLDLVKIFTFKILVVSVFDLAHSSPQKWFHLRDFRPFGSNIFEHFQNEFIFFASPVASNDLRVQHVVPSLTTLSAETPGQISGYDDPVLSSKLVYPLEKDFIFLRCPLAALVVICNRWCLWFSLGTTH